jgi:hypothetical protein
MLITPSRLTPLMEWRSTPRCSPTFKMGKHAPCCHVKALYTYLRAVHGGGSTVQVQVLNGGHGLHMDRHLGQLHTTAALPGNQQRGVGDDLVCTWTDQKGGGGATVFHHHDILHAWPCAHRSGVQHSMCDGNRNGPEVPAPALPAPTAAPDAMWLAMVVLTTTNTSPHL